MNLSEEIERLRQQYEDGTLTPEEFAQAKQTVIASANRPAVQDTVRDHQLQTIQRQNEIEQLDREWILERERYMITERYGARSLPGKGSSIIGGLVAGVFGFFWLSFANGIGAPPFFLLFGVLFIIVGIGGGIYGFVKADAYAKAEQRYHRRRAELLQQFETQN